MPASAPFIKFMLQSLAAIRRVCAHLTLLGHKHRALQLCVPFPLVGKGQGWGSGIYHYVQPGTYLTLWTGYMPDSFLGLFRFHRFMAGRPARHEAMKLFRSALDQPEIEVAEANQPIAAVGLRDPDQFPDQRFTDENQVTAPFDLAARTHPAN